jgi:hypothetical protein
MPIPIDVNFCYNITTIPQFGGTCWFNSILMASLYSEKSRKLILEISKVWDINNKFLMIIRAILLKYYKKSIETTKYFNKLKPELLLFKMLNSFGDIKLKQEFKKKLRRNGYEDLGWFDDYITNFYKFLGVNVLDITFLKNRNLYLLDFTKHLKYKSNDQGLYYTHLDDSVLLSNTQQQEKQQIKSILDKIPDVLIFYHSDFGAQTTDTVEKIYDYYSSINRSAAKSHDLSEYDISPGDISNYKDTITFGGYRYKLDSCLLGNYDISQPNQQGKPIPGHAIVGISCKNKKFVYNGWNTQTTDLAAGEKFVAKTSESCSLMEYDWDVKKDDSFCLNSLQCKLDFFKEKHNRELCFSFNKGKRILVYIKENNNDVSIDSNLSGLSSEYISDVSKIMHDFHDINQLTDYEIILKLQKHNIYLSPTFNYTREILENLLLSALKEYFNHDSNKKIIMTAEKYNEYLKKQLNYEKKKRHDKKKLTDKEIFYIKEEIKDKHEDKHTTHKDKKLIDENIFHIKEKSKEKTSSSVVKKKEKLRKLIKLNEEEEKKYKKLQFLKQEEEKALEKIKKLRVKKEKTLTKPEIINKIKLKYPNIKNLNLKKKDELLKILYDETISNKKETKIEPKKETKIEPKVEYNEEIKEEHKKLLKILKKINNIQTMKYDKIIEELAKYNINIKKDKKYSILQLKELLYDTIKKRYLIKKDIEKHKKLKKQNLTKIDLIIKIKENYPNVKNLSKFKKDILLDIYEFLL